MPDPPVPLVNAFIENRAALFIGAGVSRSVQGLPDWKELIEPLKAGILDCPNDATLLDIAQYYANQEGSVELARQLKAKLEKDDLEPSEIHHSLVRLPVDRIYTTNFDTLLERAYKKVSGRDAQRITRAAHVALTSGGLSIVKLHGDLDDPEHIVITAGDFEDYFESHTALGQQLTSDLARRVILFVGYSFTDPDIRNILRQTRRAMGDEFAAKHYILQFDPPEPVKKELERRGLKVIRLASEPSYNESLLSWLARLHEVLRQRAPKPATVLEGAKHNLPSYSGVLVGRSDEIARLIEAIQRCRVVVINGVPGIGKTSLALKVAHDLAAMKPPESFDCVVWVTARESATNQVWLNEVLNAIGLTLAFPKIAQMPPSELETKSLKVSTLLENRRVLVVLDNFEAMKDTALHEWVRRVPLPSKLLITSRTDLSGFGNGLWSLRLEGLGPKSAVDLLQQYAKDRKGDVQFSTDELMLRRIAVATGGNPQAMRLALGVLHSDKYNVEEVVGRINELKNNVDALFDQLFDWATSMLTFPGWQIVLVTALFPRAESMASDAIEASSGLSATHFSKELSRVKGLGLLTDVGNSRYAIHPKTRQLALKRLSGWAEFIDEARQRCARHYLEFIKKRIVRTQPPVPYWNVLVTDNMKLIDPEWPIIHELMHWAESSGHGDLLVDFVMFLVHYLDSRFLNAERLEYISSAVDVLKRAPTRIADQALLRIDALGWTYVEERRWQEAHEQIDKGLILADALGNDDLVALAHAWKGRAQMEEGQASLANEEIEKALRGGDSRSAWIRVRIYMAAGDIAHKQGHHEQALSFFERSFASAEEYGGEGGGYQIYPRIGMALMSLGRVSEAEERFQTVHDLQGIPIGNLYGEYGLALVARSRDDSVNAEERVERARKELEDRTTSNLLWKLLKDLQMQLKNARAGT